jgi:hypothetical protein
MDTVLSVNYWKIDRIADLAIYVLYLVTQNAFNFVTITSYFFVVDFNIVCVYGVSVNGTIKEISLNRHGKVHG